MSNFRYFTYAKLFLCAVSPTNISQYNLPPSSSSMSRSNSIPAQDSFDLYGEGHPLGGSATSLEERPRAISRSGSFRDSTDEGETPLYIIMYNAGIGSTSATTQYIARQVKLKHESNSKKTTVANTDTEAVF